MSDEHRHCTLQRAKAHLDPVSLNAPRGRCGRTCGDRGPDRLSCGNLPRCAVLSTNCGDVFAEMKKRDTPKLRRFNIAKDLANAVMPLPPAPPHELVVNAPLPGPAKGAILRRSGRLGGRGPKFQVGDSVFVNELAPIDCRERFGTIRALGTRASEYRVMFDDDEMPTHGSMMSLWLIRDE